MAKPDTITIISGGQTGADRAALDFAIEESIPCTGWCPAGRIAEDGAIDKKYPLKEIPGGEESTRTKYNVEEADGLLLIYLDNLDNGSTLALRHAKSLHKPVYLVKAREPLSRSEFEGWISSNRILRLNIAGPRESNAPGLYKTTLAALHKLFRQ